jgi:beta-carotene hydroxylase
MAIRLIAALPLLLLAQQGLHLLGWVGHEGLHLSLARNRYVSAGLGIFFSSMIINFMKVGWAASHWNHHRYTNQASDPDCQLYSRYQSFWRRLLFARLASNRVNLTNILRMVLGKPLGYAYSLPFPPHAIRVLAGFNTACSLLWLSVYAAIAIFDSNWLSIHHHTPRPGATLYRSAPVCGTCRDRPRAISGRAYLYVTVF